MAATGGKVWTRVRRLFRLRVRPFDLEPVFAGRGMPGGYGGARTIREVLHPLHGWRPEVTRGGHRGPDRYGSSPARPPIVPSHR